MKPINVKELLKSKDVLIGLGLVVLGIIIFNRIYAVKTAEISNLESRISEELKKNDLYQQISALDNKISNYASLKAISSQTDRPRLLDNISSVAAKYNLKIDTINFDREDIREFYTLVPLKITLTGKFHDLGKFVGEIESSKYFLKVVDLKISNFEDRETGEPVQRFDLLIDAVIVKD